MTYLLHKNYRFAAVHSKYLKNATINLGALCSSGAEIACCSSELVLDISIHS
jgi:hypothetical protein